MSEDKQQTQKNKGKQKEYYFEFVVEERPYGEYSTKDKATKTITGIYTGSSAKEVKKSIEDDYKKIDDEYFIALKQVRRL